MELLTQCANRNPRECEKYMSKWGVCTQHKCKNTIDRIACVPNGKYEEYVNQICDGDMPWAKVDIYPADDDLVKDKDRPRHGRSKVRLLPFLLILVFSCLIGLAMYSVFQLSKGNEMPSYMKKIEQKVNGKQKLTKQIEENDSFRSIDDQENLPRVN